MMKNVTLISIIAIFLIIALFAIGGLICWGVGSLVCYAFNINFEWTYLCGLATELIIWILGSIFKK